MLLLCRCCTRAAGCANYGYDGNEDLCTASSAQPVLSVIYFCSFIILSSMMILNLFIGVITSSMQDAKTELSEDLAAEQEEQTEDEVRVDCSRGGGGGPVHARDGGGMVIGARLCWFGLVLHMTYRSS